MNFKILLNVFNALLDKQVEHVHAEALKDAKKIVMKMKIKSAYKNTRISQLKQIMLDIDPRNDWDNVTDEISDLWHSAIDEVQEILGEDTDEYFDFMVALDKVLDSK